MAYQSTFPGVNRVSKDPSGLLQLATIKSAYLSALYSYEDEKYRPSRASTKWGDYRELNPNCRYHKPE